MGAPEVESLKSALSFNDAWSGYCTIIVFAGLLFEYAVLLRLEWKELTRKKISLTVVAGLMIAGGVGGEYFFGSKASSIAVMLEGISEQRIADANQEAGRANENAGNAILRAAELEKEAAAARLETEKIKEVVAWRVLTKENASELEKVLAAKPGSVNLRYVDGDPEALYLTIQINQILSQAHWKVAPGGLKIPNALIFGIALPDANGVDAETLRAGFSAAKIPYSTNPLPNTGATINFMTSTIAGAPTLIVGSRMPPKIP